MKEESVEKGDTDRALLENISRNPNSVQDCYVSYDFQENGNTQENVDRKLYENVSTENPISLEFPRKKDSKYKLEVKIENKDEAVLHKSGVEIHTRSEKTK